MDKIKQYIAGLALALDLLKQPFQNHHKVSNWCPSEAKRNHKGTNPSMIYLTEKEKELLKAMKEAKPVKPNLMPLSSPTPTRYITRPAGFAFSMKMMPSYIEVFANSLLYILDMNNLVLWIDDIL